MFSSRRALACILICLFTFAAAANAAFAQTAYSTKPIRVINPYPPGGSINVVARPLFGSSED